MTLLCWRAAKCPVLVLAHDLANELRARPVVLGHLVGPLDLFQFDVLALEPSGWLIVILVGAPASGGGRQDLFALRGAFWQGFAKPGRYLPFGRICLTKPTCAMCQSEAP